MRGLIVIALIVAMLLVVGTLAEHADNKKVNEAFLTISEERGLEKPVTYDGSTLIGSLGLGWTIVLWAFTSIMAWGVWKFMCVVFRGVRQGSSDQ